MLAARPLLPALVVVALATVLRLQGTVDSDVSWQLWIARQLNGGARLYRDIVEVNPPLWFWMALPVDRIAAVAQVRSDQVLIAAIGVLAGTSLAATSRLLPPMGRERRTLLLVYVALIICVMPWLQVGQREQIVLIGAIPYAGLIAARRSGIPVPPMLGLFVGLAAALGFALKHYFLVVPALLELWLATGLRKSWRPVRPETAALAAVGAAYAAAVLLWARDFLDTIVPLVMLAYGVNGAMRFVDLFQPAVITAMLTLALIGVHWMATKQEISAFASALLVCSVAFLIAYFAQAKGWHYHALPLLGCSSVGLAAILATNRRVPRVILLAAPALLLLPMAIAAGAVARETAPSADLRQAVAGLHSGESVGFIATDPALPWSIAYQRELRYPSRYMGFWMMRAIVRNEELGNPDRRLSELGRRVVRETVEDFSCTTPKRIIVARPSPGSTGEFDILPFFLRDARFAALLAHYRPVRRTSLEVYQLVTPIGGRPKCRRHAVL